MSGGDYFEGVLHGDIRRRGAAAVSDEKWEEFIKWRRRNNPGFASKLAVWLTRRRRIGGRLRDYSPAQRLRLYALLYDRAPIPFEFVTDEYAAVKAQEFAGVVGLPVWTSETATVAATVRKWRHLLKLERSPHVIAKLPHSLQVKDDRDFLVVINGPSVCATGCPYDHPRYLRSYVMRFRHP